MPYNKLTLKDKEDIIKFYYVKDNVNLSFKEMSDKLNISERAFSRVLKEKGINTKRNNRYIIHNEDYFDNIDTETKAYFLGFLYADGAVGENNDIIINLKKCESNLAIVNKFIKEIGFTGEYRIVNKNNPLTENEAIRLNFSSIVMWNDLNKLGIVPNKSLKLSKMPKINQDLYCHFIRGYFDGDGYVTNYYDKHDKRQRHVFGILGTEEFLNDIQQKLYDNLGISKIKLSKTKSEKTKDIRHKGKSNIIKIREYLYKDATICINYKKEKIFSIV